MNGTKNRLEKCFALVLPQLSADEITCAAMGSVAAWDSLATVHLVALLEEEFALQVRTEDLQYLRSFESTLAFLESKQNDVKT
jgi:acyl carrier protein